jgi:hypothetical protein
MSVNNGTSLLHSGYHLLILSIDQIQIQRIQTMLVMDTVLEFALKIEVFEHSDGLLHSCFSRIHADSHCSWGCEVFAKLHAKKLNSSPALRR